MRGTNYRDSTCLTSVPTSRSKVKFRKNNKKRNFNAVGPSNNPNNTLVQLNNMNPI